MGEAERRKKLNLLPTGEKKKPEPEDNYNGVQYVKRRMSNKYAMMSILGMLQLGSLGKPLNPVNGK